MISEINVTAMLDISYIMFGLIFGMFRIVFLWDFIFEIYSSRNSNSILYYLQNTTDKRYEFYLY